MAVDASPATAASDGGKGVPCLPRRETTCLPKMFPMSIWVVTFPDTEASLCSVASPRGRPTVDGTRGAAAAPPPRVNDRLSISRARLRSMLSMLSDEGLRPLGDGDATAGLDLMTCGVGAIYMI